jgi:uncharacterized protein YjiS (DUF1127 family)
VISLKIAQGLGLTISPRLQIAPNELIQVRADIRFLSLADIQPRYRTRRRQLYPGPIRFGRHTKNQVSLKRKSSFRQSLSGVRLAFSQMNRGIYDFFTRPSMSELTNPIGTISSQLMRWARQARTALMASCLQSVAIYLATSLGDCARYIGKLARHAAHELYLRNATRTLQQFDDRILADIGLRRAEIEQAVRNGRFATQKTLSNRMSSQQRHAA